MAAPAKQADAVPADREDGEAVPLSPGEVARRGMADDNGRIRRFEIDFDTGEVRLVYAMPDAGGLSEMARDILAALGETPDDWVIGEEVCRRVGGGVTVDRSFYRAVAELRDSGRVESNTRRGIRLKS